MRRDPFYRIVVRVGVGTLRLMRWDLHVRGVSNVPASGPAILASNHVSFLDFVWIAAAAATRGRLTRFLALREAFDHRVSGPLMRAMRHIPVDRVREPALAYRAALAALRAGEVIGLHPEGRINARFRPEGLKSGAARLALMSGAPLIPVATCGGESLWTKGHRRLLQRDVRIGVSFGERIEVGAADSYRDVNARLAEAIARQLDDLGVPEGPAGPA